MVRISSSVLGFLFDARKNKESSEAMIKNINAALKIRESQYDMLHFDIEDGKFVPFKSFTAQECRKIKTTKKREAHLMVVNYKKYLKDYFTSADMFIFHNEVLKRDFDKTIDFIKKNKKFVGISINPNTSVYDIKHLDKIDLVLIMSVYPGKPGQKFLETSLMKVKRLKELRKQHGYKFQIEIDGGINKQNIKQCVTAGIDIAVMGTGFFN